MVLLFRRLKFYILGEKFYKKFDYDWHKYSHRFDIINNIIKYKKYNSYLEIGCQADVSFKKILAPDKIGVDPMDGGTHRMTSDDFFKTNQKTFDIIFIDGLHEYSQVLRDIKNSIKFLNERWNYFGTRLSACKNLAPNNATNTLKLEWGCMESHR